MLFDASHPSFPSWQSWTSSHDSFTWKIIPFLRFSYEMIDQKNSNIWAAYITCFGNAGLSRKEYSLIPIPGPNSSSGNSLSMILTCNWNSPGCYEALAENESEGILTCFNIITNTTSKTWSRGQMKGCRVIDPTRVPGWPNQSLSNLHHIGGITWKHCRDQPDIGKNQSLSPGNMHISC